MAKYYETWANIVSNNQILKGVCVLLTLVVCVLSFVTSKLAFKKPLIINVSDKSEKILPVQTDLNTINSQELEDFSKQFSELRYNFSQETIEKQLQKVLPLTAGTLKAEMSQNLLQQMEYSKKMNLSQRFYIHQFRWNYHEQSQDKAAVEISGDQVTEIKGSKMVSGFKVQMIVEKKIRTDNNPTGLFVTFVREILPQ